MKRLNWRRLMMMINRNTKATLNFTAKLKDLMEKYNIEAIKSLDNETLFIGYDDAGEFVIQNTAIERRAALIHFKFKMIKVEYIEE
jgi:hypothetical protein